VGEPHQNHCLRHGIDPLVSLSGFSRVHHLFQTNVEVWHRLAGAPLRNRVKGCSQEGHFDSGRVAGCPPPSCSLAD
jgi:hypothetical protein